MNKKEGSQTQNDTSPDESTVIKVLDKVPDDTISKMAEGLDSADSIITFLRGFKFFTQGGGASEGVLNAINIIQQVLPPVKLALSGLLTIYLGYKYFKKFRDKPEKKARVITILGVTVNVTAALLTIAITVIGIIFPALFLLLGFLSLSIGVAKEIFNFSRTLYAQLSSKGDRLEFKNLKNQIKKIEKYAEKTPLKKNEQAELWGLEKRFEDIRIKRFARRYKLGDQVTDIAVGLLSILALALTISTGPIGWILLAGVAIAGLTVKITLLVIKNYQVKKAKERQLQLASEIGSRDDLSKRDQDKDSLKRGIEHAKQGTVDMLEEFEKTQTKREEIIITKQTKAETDQRARLPSLKGFVSKLSHKFPRLFRKKAEVDKAANVTKVRETKTQARRKNDPDEPKF